MKEYWFLVQKEYLTERLVAQSYEDMHGAKGARSSKLISYSELLREVEDTTQNEEAFYILVPLKSFFHDDLEGLIAYSIEEMDTIMEQSNWKHNQG